MRKFRATRNRQQLALLPRTVDEFVPQDDLVRYVDIMVDELDLALIEEGYSAFGRPAYSPRVMVKILLYGKMRGIRSSRELSRACRENLRFIFIASEEKPDFRTISDFRRRFHHELSTLLVQTIQIGVREKIITLDHVAIDGTKLGASASRKSFRKAAHLSEQLETLEKEIAESFSKDIAADEELDNTRDDDSSGEGKLPEAFHKKEVLRDKIKAALSHYEGVKGEKPKKVSTTDPECRYMRSKGINPSYTGLAAVDADSRMVVCGYANNSVSENAELCPSLEEIERNTGKNPTVVTADKGFRAHEGLTALQERCIDGYVPMPDETDKRFSISDFQYDPERNTYTCPNNKLLVFKQKKKENSVYHCLECTECPLIKSCLMEGKKKRTLHISHARPLVDEMIRKTTSPIGVKMAKKRSATVEPLFGYLKASKKLRQVLFRGMERINAVWKLELAAYNLERLAKFLKLQRFTLQTIT